MLFIFSNNAQQSNSTFGRNHSIFTENALHLRGVNFHTSVKPYFFSNIDSVLSKSAKNWLIRKWNYEHFFQEEKKEYSLIVNLNT